MVYSSAGGGPGDYAQAWALLNSGMTTGQTYQQFVNGFACTGAVQDFTGTDTVEGGKIVSADVTQTN